MAARHQGVAVTWKTPNAKGTPITGYQLAHRRCTANPPTCADSPNVGDWSAWTTLNYAGSRSGSEITFAIGGLTNGTAYQVRVRATSAAGSSEWSDANPLGASGSETAIPAPQAPSAPAAPTLTVWTQELRVSWAPPAANGSAITDYDVRYRACTATPKTCTTNPDWGSWTTLSGNADPGTAVKATIGSLTNDTAYQVQVQASNGIGTGDWSASATATPTAQKPEAPTAPTVSVWNAELRVSWAAPDDNDASITDYDVRYCTNSTGCDTANEWTELDDSGDNASDTGTSATITGLTNGTAYRVQVRAGNSVGDGDWSASATATPTAQKPEAPAAPTLAAKNDSLAVSWTAPDDNGASITDYDVQYRACTATDSDTSVLTCATNPTWGSWTALTGGADPGSATTATITGLSNGTAYQVQVRAANSVGEGGWSASAKQAPAPEPPDAPSAPSVTVWNAELRLSWTAPADNNGAAISDYDVQYRACTATNGNSSVLTCASNPTWGDWTEWNASDDGTTASATITGLTNGTAYQVQVRAANSAGDGAWSTSTKATPTAQKPEAPAAPSLSGRHASLAVSWTAPADNGADINDYDVRYRACTVTPKTCTTNPNWGSWTRLTGSDDPGSATSATIAGLTNSTAYQVQVRATNSVGTGQWSPSAKGSPAAEAPAAPAAPTLTVWHASLTVSWTAPADNGADITDYDVQYRACTATPKTCANSATWGDWTDRTGETTSDTATTVTLTGLTNGTAYQVQVRAANSVGESGWSTAASKAPAPQKPAAPAAPSLTFGNQSLSVSWTAPDSHGADISDYDVQYRACTATPKTCTTSPTWGDWTDRTGETTSDTATTVTLSSLTNGTAYQVRVRAANSVGEGAWSTESSEHPSTVPGAPGTPTLSVADQGLGVSWSAPSSTGSAPITGYKVGRCSTGCDTASNWTVSTLTGTGRTASLTGLTNGTAYQVRVAATNRSGDGAWSSSATATPAKAPDAPTAPSLSVWNARLTVSWTAPADNGADITDYDVRYRACTATPKTCANSATWGPWKNRTGETASDTATTVTLSGLTNNTAYQVQVRAANSVGEGSYSPSAKAIPLAQKPSAPAAPTLSHGDQSLAVSWTAPDNNGATITDYDLRYCVNSTGCDAADEWTSPSDTTSASTSATLTGLTNGTTYQVQVRAGNSVGDGAWSPSATEYPSTVPGSPAAPTLSVNDTSLGVSWSAPASNGGSTITDYDVRYRACTATPKTCANSATWGSWTEWNSGNTSDTTSATITGRTNGTAYQVQVRAANRSGDGNWSASASAVPAKAPEAPSAPALSHGDESLAVSWTAPDDNGASITDYDVRYCTNSTGCDAANEWTALNDTGNNATDTARSATISSLTNGTTYQVQVRAGNSQGDSAWSSSASEYPSTVPGVPTALTLTVKHRSLGVSWTAPSGNGGSALTGYKVQYRVKDTNETQTGDQPGDWQSHSHSGTGTTATIGSLTNGTAYQVQVRATNRSGDSSWTASTAATPANVPAAPAAPTLTKGAQQLTVAWDEPATNGAAITDYDVAYRACTATDSDTSVLTCATNPTWDDDWTDRTGETASDTATSVTITGLTNGTAYQVRVQASNSQGDSGWSTAASAAPRDKPAQPAAPTVAVWNAQLQVSWSEPAANGAPITDYDVQYRACTATDGDSAVLTCATNPTWADDWTDRTGETTSDTATSATVTGLTNGTAYQVQIRARNIVGEGDWSTATAGTPAAQKPAAPATPTLTAKHQGLAVSWTEPATNGASITDYDVQYRACTATDGNSAVLTCTTSPTWASTWTDRTGETASDTSTSTTIGSLTNGTAYQVQVRAANSVGEGGWSAAAKGTPAIQAPDAPATPALTVGNKRLAVAWTEPATNGATVTDYDVRYRACTATDGNTAVLTCASSPTWGNWTDRTGETTTDTATSVTLSGLTNGTAYQVQVRAANSVGEGGWSASGSASPAPQKPDAPGAPTLVRGAQQLTVSWNAPANNGASITDYDVRYCTNSTGCDAANEWTALNDTGDNATDTTRSATITGLTNGTAYQVQVRAGNSVGDSGWSTSASAAPRDKPARPAAPTLSYGNRSLSVSWSAPADNGASITDYDVRYCTNSTGCDAANEWTALNDTGDNATDTARSATITGLTNGTAYQVQVRAGNAVGDSAWSPSATEKPSTVPGTPAAPTLSVNDQGLGVSWSAPTGNGGSALTDYDVQYRACTATPKTCASSPTWGNWSEWNSSDTGTTPRATITGLTNGTKYEVQVRAANRSGDGQWSTSAGAIPAKAPDAPSAPTVNVWNTELQVSWPEPAANGAPITDYDVQYRACTATDGDSAVLTCATNPTWDDDWTDCTGETASDTAISATVAGLTNGTAYQVRVRAANSVDEGDWSTATAGTPAAQKPDAPAAPTLTVKNASLEVSWTAPTDNGASISDYDVAYRACTATDGDSAVLTCATNPTWASTWTDRTGETASDTATSTTIGSLTNGTAYQVRVRAANSVGEGTWSTASAAAPAPQKPDAPAAPTLTVKHQGLKVSWTEPATNGAAITDYDVAYRACTATPKSCTTNPTWTNWTDRTGETNGDTATSATITGLTDSTKYQVRVRAANSVGESSWSTASAATPAPQPPNAPAAPTITGQNGGVVATWASPTINGSAITGYNVQHRACTDTDGDTTDLACDGTTNTWGSWISHTHTGTGTTATISSLTNGTTYQVQVQATSAAGNGSWSASGSGAPTPEPPDDPSAPTLTHANASLSVSWNAPDTNGSAITGYNVQYRACTATNGDATVLTCATTPTWGDWTSHTHTGTGTTATISSLTNGTKHQVQVQATSAAGNTGWSSSASATPSTVPGEPTVTLSAVTGSPTVSRVSWTVDDDGGSPILEYRIIFRCHPGNAWSGNPGRPASWLVSAPTTSRDSSISECSSKLSTSEYRFMVAARNANGWGTSSWPFVKTTVPAAVAASSVTTALSGTTMTVSWNAPADDGGLEITDYDVRYREKDTDQNQSGDQPGTWTTLTGSNDPGSTASATISGLSADTVYQVQVRATNARGASAWSTSKNWPQPPTTSGSPTVSATHQGLSVSWAAFSANDAAITDYDVAYRACTATPKSCTTSPTWGNWTNRTGETTTDTDTSAVITGLTNGTAYQVRVRAANFAGEGAWSTEGVGTPAIVAPDAPAAPALSVASTTSLTASWSAPAQNGSAITD